jgi:hypothetical protein
VARRQKLLSISAGLRGQPALRVRWIELEKATGWKIVRKVRAAIRSATCEYLIEAALEAKTPPISREVARVRRLLAAATEINAVHEERVRDAQRTPYVRIRADKLYALALAARDMPRACEAELAALAGVAAEDSGYREGEAWSWWIRHLTRILEEAGLPTAVRKKASPFVAFVTALSRCLSVQFRRHLHSDGALAKAIERARGSFTQHPPGWDK